MRYKLLWILLAFTTLVSAQNRKNKDTMEIKTGHIVRISIGYFNPEQTEKVESLL